VVDGHLVGPGADLADDNFTGADLTGADLTGADLKGAYLNDAVLSNVSLAGAKLNGVSSGGVTGTPATLPTGWALIGGYLLVPLVFGQSVTFQLPAGTRGAAYSFSMAVTGGRAPFTWKSTQTLPKGLMLSPSGVLSGIPKSKLTPGKYSIDVKVTDSTQPYHQVAAAVLTLVLL
jgi:hypothetical protein